MMMNTPAPQELSASGVEEAKKVGGALNILFDLDKVNKKNTSISEDRHIAASQKLIKSIDELLARRHG